MSFQAFMANPIAYCAIHEMLLVGSATGLAPAAMTAAAPVVHGPGAGPSILYTHIGNVRMMLAGQSGAKTSWAHPTRNGIARIALSKVRLSNKRNVQYQAALGGTTPNLRVLPWVPGAVTFMQLDGGADFAVTGPLTGCTVAVARGPGNSLWFFHANVAGFGGVGAANLITKRTMIMNAGALVGVLPIDLIYCEYGPGQTYDGMGFAWGRSLVGGFWEFHVHAVSHSQYLWNATKDTMWAAL